MVPLHWACDRGNVEIVNVLILNGAQINIKVSPYNIMLCVSLYDCINRTMMDRLHYIMVSYCVIIITYSIKLTIQTTCILIY